MSLNNLSGSGHVTSMVSPLTNFIKTVDLDMGEAVKLLTTADRDVVHGICRGILLRSLVSMGLHVEPATATIKKKDKKRKRGEEGEEEEEEEKRTSALKAEENILNKFWLPTVVDLLFYGSVLGFVPWTLQEVEDTSRVLPGGSHPYVKLPIVVPVDLIKVTFNTRPDFSREVVVTMSAAAKGKILDPLVQAQDLKPLYYFPILGYEPSKEYGYFRSVVSMTRQGTIWIDQLYSSFVKAQTQRSHPPYVIQHSAQGKGSDSNIFSIEKSDIAVSSLVADKRVYDQKQSTNQLDAQDTYTMIGRGGSTGLKKSPYTGATGEVFTPTTLDEKYDIPIGFEAANPQPPMPEPQADLLNYNAARMREVCALYGIPPSAVVSDAKSNTSSSTVSIDDNDNLALQRTLNFWQSIIISFITEAYLKIKKELNGVSDVSITLPIIPYTSTTKMHEFVDRNIVSTDTGKRYIAAIAGLSKEDILEGENEHNVPPIHGNENQTTPIMRAKEAVMRAEEKERLAKAKETEKGEEGGKHDGEILDKQMELETMQVEGKMKVMEKQMELTGVQTEAAIKKADAAVKVAKAKPKGGGSGTKA